nr:hypothetical protein [Frankia nepalensis]
MERAIGTATTGTVTAVVITTTMPTAMVTRTEIPLTTGILTVKVSATRGAWSVG